MGDDLDFPSEDDVDQTEARQSSARTASRSPSQSLETCSPSTTQSITTTSRSSEGLGGTTASHSSRSRGSRSNSSAVASPAQTTSLSSGDTGSSESRTMGRTKAQRRRLRLQNQKPLLPTIHEQQQDHRFSQASSLSQPSSTFLSQSSVISTPPRSQQSGASSTQGHLCHQEIEEEESTLSSFQSSRKQPSYSKPLKRRRKTNSPTLTTSDAARRPKSDAWLEDDNSETDKTAARRRRKKKALFTNDYNNGKKTPAEMPGVTINRESTGFFSTSNTEVGGTEIMLDDCQFACSTLMDPKSSARSAWQAAVQLSKLLSRASSRDSLWQDPSALTAVLEMFGNVPTRLANDLDGSPYRDLLINGLSACTHFVSLDCCVSDHSVFRSAAQNRRFRESLLQHSTALQGFLTIAIEDTVVQKYHKQQEFTLPDDPWADATLAANGHNEKEATPSSTASTPASQSTCSQDPTAAGRQRRRKRRKFGTPTRSGTPASLSFGSPASIQSTESQGHQHLQDLAEEAEFQVLQTIKAETRRPLLAKHACEYFDENPPGIALLAVQRIVTGKTDDNSASCLDDSLDDTKDNELDASNPLLTTNQWLADGDAIPLLSQAMAETLLAIVEVIESKKTLSCEGCLEYLHSRLAVLASLVDGACLFHEGNRQQFCTEGYMESVGGCLIVSVLYVLRKLTLSTIADVLHATILTECLRTLTSLTHENALAATELERTCSGSMNWWGDQSTRGIDIVLCTLYASATSTQNSTAKSRYDCVIFCLNTLTNISGHGRIKNLLSMAKVEDTQELFLSWLTQWLVSQTSSFREAVAGIGETARSPSGRTLEVNEDERLLTVGNGFVLLACLMTYDNGGPTKTSWSLKAAQALRDTVFICLPGDNTSQKLRFMTNTLRAFCNFYHYSVGDLSLAIVVPVKKLIVKLEAVSED